MRVVINRCPGLQILEGLEAEVVNVDYLPFNETSKQNPWLDVRTPAGKKIAVLYEDVTPIWSSK